MSTSARSNASSSFRSRSGIPGRSFSPARTSVRCGVRVRRETTEGGRGSLVEVSREELSDGAYCTRCGSLDSDDKERNEAEQQQNFDQESAYAEPRESFSRATRGHHRVHGTKRACSVGSLLQGSDQDFQGDVNGRSDQNKDRPTDSGFGADADEEEKAGTNREPSDGDPREDPECLITSLLHGLRCTGDRAFTTEPVGADHRLPSGSSNQSSAMIRIPDLGSLYPSAKRSPGKCSMR